MRARPLGVRPYTEHPRLMALLVRKKPGSVPDAPDIPDILRPTRRGECADGDRPCPWVSCRYHLFLDVTPTGTIKINFPGSVGRVLSEMPDTCALDVADRGPQTLEAAADRLNLSRERGRQLEALLTVKLRRRMAVTP